MDSLLSMGNPLERNDKSVINVSNGLNELSLRPTLSPSVESSSKTSTSVTTISHISGLHSHRNVKPLHQILLAESMFDESIPLNIDCRLNKTLKEIVCDNNVLPYFIQFMESIGSVSKHLIRFWIQTECLTVSQKNLDSMKTQCDEQQNDNKFKINEYKQQFINDANGIFNKYLSQSIYNIDIPIEIKNEIEEQLSINKSDISHDLFSKAQSYVLTKIENDYYELFKRSTYYCKYEVDVLTSGSVRLADILFNNSKLATNFIEFMEIEGMKPYVDFLIMFENYRKFSNHLEDAIAIFDRFFSSDNSTNNLGFSDNLRHYISQKLDQNNFSSDCFDKMAAILIQYFEKTYLRQFLESELYFEYLTHCIQSIQMDLSHNKKYQIHKRTNSDSSYNSDCSFVSSVGTRDGDCVSTASPLKYKQKSSHLSEDQKSDSLWKRDLSGKLQFTHIDKYGRISSCLEPEPDRISSGTLTKVMKRFSLYSSDDKEKEEIAWKIARMIVNDVCNTTQELSHTST